MAETRGTVNELCMKLIRLVRMYSVWMLCLCFRGKTSGSDHMSQKVVSWTFVVLPRYNFLCALLCESFTVQDGVVYLSIRERYMNDTDYKMPNSDSDYAIELSVRSKFLKF